MANTSPKPDGTGKSKPETPTKPAPSKPRVISWRVFNDFAAI